MGYSLIYFNLIPPYNKPKYYIRDIPYKLVHKSFALIAVVCVWICLNGSVPRHLLRPAGNLSVTSLLRSKSIITGPSVSTVVGPHWWPTAATRALAESFLLAHDERPLSRPTHNHFPFSIMPTKPKQFPLFTAAGERPESGQWGTLEPHWSH